MGFSVGIHSRDVREGFGDRPAAQAAFVRLTLSGAMVAETVDGDKLRSAEAVAIGQMVPI